MDREHSLPHYVPILSFLTLAAILFFGGYFYLQSNQVGRDEGGSNTSLNKEQAEKNLKIQKANAKADSTRKSDVSNINKGLAKHFAKNKTYPKNLEALTPKFLTIIPLDPVSKEPYNYVPSENRSAYTLSTTLSDGSNYTVSSEN